MCIERNLIYLSLIVIYLLFPLLSFALVYLIVFSLSPFLRSLLLSLPYYILLYIIWILLYLTLAHSVTILPLLRKIYFGIILPKPIFIKREIILLLNLSLNLYNGYLFMNAPYYALFYRIITYKRKVFHFLFENKNKK